jgi:hypothetical protein
LNLGYELFARMAPALYSGDGAVRRRAAPFLLRHRRIFAIYPMFFFGQCRERGNFKIDKNDEIFLSNPEWGIYNQPNLKKRRFME